MNKTINNTGFLPLTISHINFDTNAIKDAINSISKSLNPYSTAFIVEGCTLAQSGPDVILSAGAIWYNDELFQVDTATFGSNTLSVVQTYSFDLLQQYDANSQKQYLNGNVYETRQIRKAILVPAPATFTSTTYSSIDVVFIKEVDTDLQTHKSKGNNHDYLANHSSNGNFIDVIPVLDSGATSLDTNSTKYFSQYYSVGNEVIWTFCLPLTFTNGNNYEIVLSMPNTFPIGLGYGRCSFINTTDVNNYGQMINSLPQAEMIVYLTSSNIQEAANYIRFVPTGIFGRLTDLNGSISLLGSLTFKKPTA